VLALVAQRAREPGSKLAGTRWVAERVAIEHLAGRALGDLQVERGGDLVRGRACGRVAR